MKQEKNKNTIINNAYVKNSEKIICDNCSEHILFLLSDSKNNEFSVGLTTMLECVAFAIQKGDLPKLPSSWLKNIDDVYSTSFSFDKDISYDDYCI
ncbi:MAG: hypothetical protein Q4A46_07200 [Clostridia bacterium]|nr:hypothetical protein [Clostridia bacterium]